MYSFHILFISFLKRHHRTFFLFECDAFCNGSRSFCWWSSHSILFWLWSPVPRFPIHTLPFSPPPSPPPPFLLILTPFLPLSSSLPVSPHPPRPHHCLLLLFILKRASHLLLENYPSCSLASFYTLTLVYFMTMS